MRASYWRDGFSRCYGVSRKLNKFVADKSLAIWRRVLNCMSDFLTLCMWGARIQAYPYCVIQQQVKQVLSCLGVPALAPIWRVLACDRLLGRAAHYAIHLQGI